MHVSKTALRALGLDYVWWLVSPQNPLKSENVIVRLEQRLTTALKMAQHPRVIVTDIENEFGTIHTTDTLKALLQRFPAAHFIWLMGSDNLVQIPRWRDWRTIFAMVPVAVVSRPGTALKARNGTAAQTFKNARATADIFFATRCPPAWTVIDAQHDRTSATQIRSQHRK